MVPSEAPSPLPAGVRAQLLHQIAPHHGVCGEGLAQDLHDALPGAFLPPVPATGCWRRARLLPGGDLLAIFEGHGLVKLDKRSRLIWSYAGKCHHDLDLDADGNINVLTREADVVHRLHPDDPAYRNLVARRGIKFLRQAMSWAADCV